LIAKANYAPIAGRSSLVVAPAKQMAAQRYRHVKPGRSIIHGSEAGLTMILH
jgi:hypothetical protein